MAQVKNINLTDVHTSEILGFFQQIAAETVLVSVEADQQVISTFCTATNSFAEATKYNMASSFTEARKEADELTDHICVGLRKFADANTYSPNSEVVVIAQHVLSIIEKYGYLIQMSYKSQYPNVSLLLNDLKSLPAEDVEKMGLAIWIAALEDAYHNFVSLTKDKMDEENEKQVGIVADTRMAAQEAYYAMISRLNMGAGYMGDEPYIPFINKVNTIIDVYKAEIAARKTRPANKKKEEEKQKAALLAQAQQ